MKIELNLPSLQRRLKLVIRSLKVRLPIWGAHTNFSLSNVDSLSERESLAINSIFRWLFNFSFPDTHMVCSSEKCILYLPSNIIGPLEQLKSHLDFVDFQLKENVLFKSVDTPNLNTSTSLEAFSHLSSIKDDQELTYLSLGSLFISDLLKKKVVPLIEEFVSTYKNDPPTESSDLLSQKTNQAAVAFLQEFIDKQNSEAREDEVVSPDSFKFEKSQFCVDFSNEGGKIFRIKLLVYCGGYFSKLERTIIVDPKEAAQNEYNHLLELFRRALLKSRDEAKIAEIVNTMDAYAAKAKSEGIEVSNVYGKCINLEGLENEGFDLKSESKSAFHLKENMVYCFTIKIKTTGVQMALSDMVVIKKNRAELMTHCARKFSKICYSSSEIIPKKKERKDEVEVVEGPRHSRRLAKIMNQPQQNLSNIMNSIIEKLKSNKSKFNAIVENEQKRWLELADRDLLGSSKKNKQLESDAIEFLERLIMSGNPVNNDRNNQEELVNNSYKKPFNSVNEIPNFKKLPNRIILDENKEVLLLPLGGRLVPISISFLKTVALTEAAGSSYLRLIFLPIPLTFRAVQPERGYDNKFLEAITDLASVKELTFKSTNMSRLADIYNTLRAFIKNKKAQIKENIAKATLIKQKKLLLSRDPIALRDVQIRPSLSTRRKTIGRLELHSNGFRFTDNWGARLDILFENISFAVFQPALNSECNILLHFQLREEQLVHKKRTEWLQIFFDTSTASIDLSKTSRFADEDESRKRKRFSVRFSNFVNAAEQSHRNWLVEQNKMPSQSWFDEPHKDLLIMGNISRSMTPVFLSGEAIYALNDNSPLVIMLSEVRMAYLERMVEGIRSLDVSIVFHDLTKDPIRISSIDKIEAEKVKYYFEQAGITVLEGHVNLDWKTLMGQIRADPKDFVDQGGWKFLVIEGEEDEEYEPKEDSEEVVKSSDIASEEDEDLSETEELVEEDDKMDEDEDDEEGEGEIVDWSNEEDESEE